MTPPRKIPGLPQARPDSAGSLTEPLLADPVASPPAEACAATEALSAVAVPAVRILHPDVTIPTPERWETGDHLTDFLEECHRIGINDITMQTGGRLLGKRHGRYRPCNDKVLSSTDMGILFTLLYRGGALAYGEHARVAYDMWDYEGRARRYRVTITRTAGITEGMSFVFREMPRDPMSWTDLSMPEELMKAYAHMKYGAALVAGKNESGKSWFQAAIMKYWADDPYLTDKIVYYGSPCEFMFTRDNFVSGDHFSSHDIPRSHSNYSTALSVSKSQTPNRIVLEELTGTEPMTMFIDAAVTGLSLYGTMHLSCIADLPLAMDQYFPNLEERDSRLKALISALNVITVQRLEPRAAVDGVSPGRVAVREYLILDENVRQRILAEPISTWRRVLQELVDSGISRSCSMVKHGRELMNAGIIGRDTFNKIERGLS